MRRSHLPSPRHLYSCRISAGPRGDRSGAAMPCLKQFAVSFAHQSAVDSAEHSIVQIRLASAAWISGNAKSVAVAQPRHLSAYRASLDERRRSVVFSPNGAVKRLAHLTRSQTRSRMLLQYSGIYDPEDLTVLGATFDRAIASLPACMRTPENRIAIAKLVLERTAASQSGLASLMLLLDALPSAHSVERRSEERPPACVRMDDCSTS